MQSQQVELIISYQHKHNNAQHPSIKSILGTSIPFSFYYPDAADNYEMMLLD